MSDTRIVRIGPKEYWQLTSSEQQSLRAWVKSFFDCNPDDIERIEFTIDPTVVNWAMRIGLLIRENPKRPTLVSEMHSVQITTLVPDGLLKRLLEVSERTAA